MGILESFLGGAGLRYLVSWISEFFTKKQDHQIEIETLKLRGQLDESAHLRELEKIKVLSDLGSKEVRIKADADLSKIDAQAFAEVSAIVAKPTGNVLVDVWNGIIRPAAASISLLLWVGSLSQQGWVMADRDWALVGVILGFYFASRSLATGTSTKDSK